MDLYFQRHDGQAVTSDDFVQAMQDASGVDLDAVQALVRPGRHAGARRDADVYDAATRRYTLTVRAVLPADAGQPEKQPLHIPLAVGLVGPQASDMPLRLEGETAAGGTTRVLSLTRSESSVFRFVDVPERAGAFARARLLRAGDRRPRLQRRRPCAPAGLRQRSVQPLGSGPAPRYEPAARRRRRGAHGRRSRDVPESFVAAFAPRARRCARSDPAFAAEALALPSEGFLAEQMTKSIRTRSIAVRVDLRRQLADRAARRAAAALTSASRQAAPTVPTRASAGRRALRNLCLGYLMELDDEAARGLCVAAVRARRQHDRLRSPP